MNGRNEPASPCLIRHPIVRAALHYWLTVLVGVLIAFAHWRVDLDLITTAGSAAPSPPETDRGPRSAYTLAEQPRRFWFEIVSQCVGTLFFIAVGWIGLWIHRMAREPGDSEAPAYAGKARDTRAFDSLTHLRLSSVIPMEHQIARSAAANVCHVTPCFAIARGDHGVLTGWQLHVHQRPVWAEGQHGLPRRY